MSQRFPQMWPILIYNYFPKMCFKRNRTKEWNSKCSFLEFYDFSFLELTRHSKIIIIITLYNRKTILKKLPMAALRIQLWRAAGSRLWMQPELGAGMVRSSWALQWGCLDSALKVIWIEFVPSGWSSSPQWGSKEAEAEADCGVRR